MPHAYDPDIHYPAQGNDREYDFSFIGTMFKSRRDFFEEFFSAIDVEKYNIALGGAAWDGDHMDGSFLLKYLSHPRDEAVDNDVVADTYRKSRVGINFYRKEAEEGHQDEGWAVGPREVELAACALPWIRDARGESDELFPFLPTFRTPGEAAALLKWHLDHEYESRDLGRRARGAIQHRTFDNHAKMLMGEMIKFGLL
jgi:glycosyl transferase family 1